MEDKKEGLTEQCTAKGKKGSRRRVLNLFVAVSYNKEVISCHRYEKLDRQFFEKFSNIVKQEGWGEKGGALSQICWVCLLCVSCE